MTYLGFGELCESISVQTGEVCVNVRQSPLRLGQQLQPTTPSCWAVLTTTVAVSRPREPQLRKRASHVSTDEQPAGLLGQSQQNEQTHYEVKQQQQHPGEKGLGTKPPVGTIVGATEGGTGVRGMMAAPMMLSFPRPATTLSRAREMEERRLITFSDNLRQFLVDARKGLLPVKSSSIEVRGPETDSCSPEIVSEILGVGGRQNCSEYSTPPSHQHSVTDATATHVTQQMPRPFLPL
ncbi:hypothetical protein EYF80_008707 [Liparis tanakae]|uniref:Uncharacterized protein n=1 Tax=Liparis tanakae TaxID=230148 RepID=A0A4Z2ITA0_9TELE|nr:hypothetical protein EYF80_008707 [Liparis tanakae]